MLHPTPLCSLDHYARLARRLLRAPVGLVTLVNEHEQVHVGADGLAGPGERRGPLTHSFCHLVVQDRHALVVADARRDPRLAQHPAVLEKGVVAYAGWPLYDRAGQAVGSLCAVDYVPRVWTAAEVDVLRELAAGCTADVQRDEALADLLAGLASLEQELTPSHHDVADKVAAIRRTALTPST